MTDILHRAINAKCADKKRKENIVLSYKDLVLMSELINSGMEDEKLKSNKRQRLKARLNIERKYDLYLFINLIYSLPPSLLNVSVKEGVSSPANKNVRKEPGTVPFKHSVTMYCDKFGIRAEMMLEGRRRVERVEL